jgi:hypothetical protein
MKMLFSVMIVGLMAFGCASQAKLNPYQKCMQRPVTECAQFGSVYNPNFPYSVKKQSNVTGVEYMQPLVPNPYYNPKKKTYDPVAYFSCAEPIYNSCNKLK